MEVYKNKDKLPEKEKFIPDLNIGDTFRFFNEPVGNLNIRLENDDEGCWVCAVVEGSNPGLMFYQSVFYSTRQVVDVNEHLLIHKEDLPK